MTNEALIREIELLKELVKAKDELINALKSGQVTVNTGYSQPAYNRFHTYPWYYTSGPYSGPSYGPNGGAGGTSSEFAPRPNGATGGGNY